MIWFYKLHVPCFSGSLIIIFRLTTDVAQSSCYLMLFQKRKSCNHCFSSKACDHAGLQGINM